MLLYNFLAGLRIYFIIHFSDGHYFYHGAVITEWNTKSSVSLGMFVFVINEPYFYDKLKNEYSMEEISQRLGSHTDNDGFHKIIGDWFCTDRKGGEEHITLRPLPHRWDGR